MEMLDRGITSGEGHHLLMVCSYDNSDEYTDRCRALVRCSRKGRFHLLKSKGRSD
jgi:hypothetical protein